MFASCTSPKPEPNVFDDNSQTIGNTPLVRLNRISEGGATIYAKLESRNPANSVKDRIGSNLIWDAEDKGLLRPGMEIVEPTSGNTGIALAFVAAARGYGITLTMPSSMSLERRKVLKALGANLILTEPAKGMKGAVEKAREMAETDPSKYYMPSQFDNPANPAIHEKTTGPEIYNALHGKVDAFIAGVGTGGTISGVTRYLKKTKNVSVKAVAVEPAASPIITQTLKGEPITPAGHKIQGIGANFIPGNLDLALLDAVETVENDAAIDMARRLMKDEGILSGISGGAAVSAAIKVAKELGEGKNVVVIIPDSGERYLSTALFDGIFTEQENNQ